MAAAMPSCIAIARDDMHMDAAERWRIAQSLQSVLGPTRMPLANVLDVPHGIEIGAGSFGHVYKMPLRDRSVATNDVDHANDTTVSEFVALRARHKKQKRDGMQAIASVDDDYTSRWVAVKCAYIRKCGESQYNDAAETEQRCAVLTDALVRDNRCPSFVLNYATHCYDVPLTDGSSISSPPTTTQLSVRMQELATGTLERLFSTIQTPQLVLNVTLQVFHALAQLALHHGIAHNDCYFRNVLYVRTRAPRQLRLHIDDGSGAVHVVHTCGIEVRLADFGLATAACTDVLPHVHASSETVDDDQVPLPRLNGSTLALAAIHQQRHITKYSMPPYARDVCAYLLELNACAYRFGPCIEAWLEQAFTVLDHALFECAAAAHRRPFDTPRDLVRFITAVFGYEFLQQAHVVGALFEGRRRVTDVPVTDTDASKIAWGADDRSGGRDRCSNRRK